MIYLVLSITCMVVLAMAVIVAQGDVFPGEASSVGAEAGSGAGPGPGPGTNASIPRGAIVGRSVNDFSGVNNSEVYPKGKGTEIVNITDVGDGVMQFLLRNRGDWYDGDRDLRNNNKGLGKARAEVSGLGKTNQVAGETWEYGTTVKLDANFRPMSGFCNIMQQAQISFVRLTKLKGNVVTGGLYYVTNRAEGEFHPQQLAREFTVNRGDWITLVVRVKVHQSDGECTLSVNGDNFKGARGVQMIKNKPYYSGNWGLYGSVTKDVNGKPLGDNVVWHKDIWLRKVS